MLRPDSEKCRYTKNVNKTKSENENDYIIGLSEVSRKDETCIIISSDI